MGKVKKQKQHQKFDYNKNRKNIRRKEKKLPDIRCPEIKKAWDNTRSLKRNLRDMGLSSDANKTIKFPTKKTSRRGMIEEVEEMDVIEKTPEKNFVVEELEKQSNIPVKKKMTMSDEEAGLCVYMLDKYADDYKAMARDRRNHYQETPKQLKKKIDRFKSIPEMYQIYAEGRQGNTTPMKENLQVESSCFTKINVTANMSSIFQEHHDILGMAPQRCATRLYDAGLRNGHFTSPQSNSFSQSAVIASSPALCRVRRKLHFGRKAPKDRSRVNSENE